MGATPIPDNKNMFALLMGGGGVPYPVLNRGGTPSSPGWGRVPPSSLDWGGTPILILDRVPPPPPHQQDGVPPSRPGMGFPPSIPGMGTPPPRLDLGWGTPPPIGVNGRTPVKTLPSPFLRNVGGKNVSSSSANGH